MDKDSYSSTWERDLLIKMREERKIMSSLKGFDFVNKIGKVKDKICLIVAETNYHKPYVKMSYSIILVDKTLKRINNKFIEYL